MSLHALRERLGAWIAGEMKAAPIMPIPSAAEASYMDVWNAQPAPDMAALVKSYEGTAYACANLCAQGVAATPMRLYVGTGQGQPEPKCVRRAISTAEYQRLAAKAGLSRKLVGVDNLEEVAEHPILVLLDSVNAELDGFTLMELTQLYMEVTGSAYWYLERTLDIITAIWVLQSQFVTPVYRNGAVVSYEYGSGEDKAEYPVKAILPFHMPNLHNPYNEGLSPLRAAYENVHLQEQEIAQAQALMNNMGRPDIILSPKNDYGALGPDEHERLHRKFRRAFRRSRVGGMLLLGEQFDVTPLTFSPKDLESAVLHGITKENIANAYGVPMSLLQTKDVNRANAEAGHYQLAHNAILPRCRRLEQRLTQRFATLFDPRLILAFDDPVPENRELRLQERVQMVGSGVMKINEAREEMGLDPIPEGDVNLVDGTKVILGDEPEPAPEPPAPAVNEEPEENPEAEMRVLDVMIRHCCKEIDSADAMFGLTAEGIPPHVALNWLAPVKIAPLANGCTDNNPGPYIADWDVKLRRIGHGRRLPQGSKLRATMQEIFREQKRATLREFKALAYADMKAPARLMPGSAASIFDAEEWSRKMAVEVEPIWGTYMDDGITATATRLSTRVDDIVPRLTRESAAVVEAVATQSMKFCEATNATTALQLNRALDAVRQEIAQGLLGAENTLPALTKRVSGVFEQAEQYRAERIARTEASRAIHLGQRMEAVESGVVRGYRWLLSGDACPMCQDIAASMPEIPLDGKFATLGSGEYADVWAPPAHPNCMCTITEVLIDE